MQPFIQPVSVYSTKVVTGFNRESTWEKNPLPKHLWNTDSPKTRHPKAIPSAGSLSHIQTPQRRQS